MNMLRMCNECVTNCYFLSQTDRENVLPSDNEVRLSFLALSFASCYAGLASRCTGSVEAIKNAWPWIFWTDCDATLFVFFLAMFFGTFHKGLGEDLRAFFLGSNNAAGFCSLALFCGDHLSEPFHVFPKMWHYGSQRSKAKRGAKRGQGRGHCDDKYMTTSRLSAFIYIRSQKEAWCANTLWFGTRDEWWMPFVLLLLACDIATSASYDCGRRWRKAAYCAETLWLGAREALVFRVGVWCGTCDLWKRDRHDV